MRAFQIGYEVAVTEGELHFRPASGSSMGGGRRPGGAVAGAAAGALGLGAAKLVFGDNLRTFKPRLSAANLVPEVEVRIWDPERRRRRGGQHRDHVGHGQARPGRQRPGGGLRRALRRSALQPAVDPRPAQPGSRRVEQGHHQRQRSRAPGGRAPTPPPTPSPPGWPSTWRRPSPRPRASPTATRPSRPGAEIDIENVGPRILGQVDDHPGPPHLRRRRGRLPHPLHGERAQRAIAARAGVGGALTGRRRPASTAS